MAPEVAANPGTRVVVVENGSGDDSAERIGDFIGTSGGEHWCSMAVSEGNRGFAGGNNLGIADVTSHGGAKYFLLLNSDTIVQPGCLARCLNVMELDPGIGAMSCRLLNADGTIQNVCRRFPTPLRCLASASSLVWRLPTLFSWADTEDPGWDRNTVSRDVDWIGGAFMLVQGDWIARHGGLDERFFFYGEDIEFCHRIHQTGLRVHYSPVATVVHFGGASSDPSRMAASIRNLHRWRGRYLVQRVCYGRAAEVTVRCIDLANVAVRVLWSHLVGRNTTPKHAAMVDLLHLLARNWKERNEHNA